MNFFDLSPAQKAENNKKLVVVGMSGGVDSSVSALILKNAGFRVLGMFMRNWEEKDENGRCTSAVDYEDVAATCAVLDIPHQTVDFVEEYREQVFSHFLEEYKAGHTPNPDILCNREIKFKVFFQKAMQLGADFLATGHYCRTDGSRLLTGLDKGKDQSYFLYAISSEVLSRVLFPVGGLQKPEVRRLAKEAGLPTQAKKDSTGICFIGERNFRKFMQNYIAIQPGDFKTLDGTIVGRHQGIAYYTLGQRRNLGLGGPGARWFVVDKSKDTNTVWVERGDHHPHLYADSLTVNELNWLGPMPEFPLQCSAKIRYRQQAQPCMIEGFDESGMLQVRFQTPQRAIVSRQSIVFYLEDHCLGGGMISHRGPSYFESQKPLPKTDNIASLT